MMTPVSTFTEILAAVGDAAPKSVGSLVLLLCLAIVASLVITLAWRRHLLQLSNQTRMKHAGHISKATNRLTETKAERLKNEQIFKNFEEQIRHERNQSEIRDLENKAILHRPIYERRIYNIGMIGTTGAGKTGLLRRLTEPYFNYAEAMAQTVDKEEYDSVVRTVIHEERRSDRDEKIRQEDVFHWIGWAGEQNWTASAELQAMCDHPPARGRVPGVHGLIFVVDLAAPPTNDLHAPHAYDPDRITHQIHNFPEKYFKILFRLPITRELKIVMLFINKIDVLDASDIESAKNTAIEHYKPLINNIATAYGTPPTVIVGSVKHDVALATVLSTLVKAVFPSSQSDQGSEKGGGQRVSSSSSA